MAGRNTTGAARANTKKIGGTAVTTVEKRRYYRDYSLIACLIFLLCFGLVMVYSASYYTAQINNRAPSYYFVRQLLFTVAGFVVMLIVSRIDYRIFKKAAIPLYVLSVILMLAVDFTPLGIVRNGQKRWFGIGDHQLFQAADVVKIAIIVFAAYFIAKYIRKIDGFARQFALFGLVLIPAALVLKNNLSSGIIILIIPFIMVFVASRGKKRFIVTVAIIAAAAVFAVFWGEKLIDMGILQEYQFRRIFVWQDPETYISEGGYQVMQGLYAIGSGGFFGKGLGNGVQKLGFVPEAGNDMIFSIVCEELGLFGAICLIVLYIFLIYRCVVIASNAPDMFGSMLVVGVLTHIAVQVILNIAVVTNVIPNTGVTLPFVSYGGTSAVMTLAEMGLVLGVSRRIELKRV